MSVVKLVIIYNFIFKLLGFILTVLFIIAKLINWIDWSWWWILIPIFLPSLYMISYKEESDQEGD